MGMEMEPYIGTIEAAKYCRVTRPTFRNWINAGLIEAYITPGGTAKVSVKALIKMMRERKMPIPEELLRFATIRMLVAEDDKMQRILILESFRGTKRLLIEEAGNAFQTGLKIGAFQPDIILFDIFNPKTAGIELLKEIKECKMVEKSKIIAFATTEDCLEAKEVKKIGVDQLIIKPINLQDLKKVIKSMIDIDF